MCGPKRVATLLLALASAATVAQCGRRGDTAATEFNPVATVDQLMDAIVVPSSEAIFDAVVYTNGELTAAPRTDDDWFRVQMHALAVAEAGNLLLIPPRAKDTGEWTTLTRAMTDQAVVVARAAEARDLDGLLKTGGELYSTCTGCHAKYLPEE